MLSGTRRRLVQMRLTSRHNLTVPKSTKSKALYPDNEKHREVLLADREILRQQTNKLRYKLIRRFAGFLKGFLITYMVGTAVCIGVLTWILKHVCPFDMFLEVQFLAMGDSIDRRAIRSWKSWFTRKLGGMENVAGAIGIMLSVEQVRMPWLFLFYLGLRRYRTIHTKEHSIWRFHAPEE